MRRRYFVGTGGVTVAFAAGVAAWQFMSTQSSTDTDVSLKPDDPVIVERGADIYAAECAACHGANLEGDANWQGFKPDGRLPAPPHDDTGHTWHHGDRLLFELTKFGLARYLGQEEYKTDMPVYESVLSDADIIAVLSYIKSRWPEDLWERHDQLNEAVARQE